MILFSQAYLIPFNDLSFFLSLSSNFYKHFTCLWLLELAGITISVIYERFPHLKSLVRLKLMHERWIFCTYAIVIPKSLLNQFIVEWSILWAIINHSKGNSFFFEIFLMLRTKSLNIQWFSDQVQGESSQILMSMAHFCITFLWVPCVNSCILDCLWFYRKSSYFASSSPKKYHFENLSSTLYILALFIEKV